MPHTITPIPTVNFPTNAPGSNIDLTVFVEGAVQPDSSVTGSIAVAFEGETVSAPLYLAFTELV